MPNLGNVLLVDDEASWRRIYEDGIRDLGISEIRSAKSLTEAEKVIDAMKFSVAIIDIGLDTSDETNVDGLSVMAKLRAVGDNTRIIVITGRTGGDVIDVVSESIQKYGAAATFAKGKLTSTLLRDAVADALRTYEKHAVKTHTAVQHVLRRGEDQMVWDDSLMRVLGIKDGVAVLYDFLEKLLDGYLPLIASDGGKVMEEDFADGLAYGEFWSRAIGKSIVVILGHVTAVNHAVTSAIAEGLLVDRYQVGEILSEYSADTSKGVVYTLTNRDRLQFRTQ